MGGGLRVRNRPSQRSEYRRLTCSVNLRFVVNNSRFLILPWVSVPHLASAILAGAVRQLPADWAAAHGSRRLLLETFVDARRFRGTCYRTANWQLLADTQGRGHMGRPHVAEDAASKRIFVYLLVDDVDDRLGPTTSTLTPSCAPRGR